MILRYGRMRVPGVVFATRALIPDPAADRALEQVVNVAELPGIVAASYAMPDVHWGYGFPIGGVATTDVARGGVISPGGVGFDVACGVRLLAADLGQEELLPVLGRVMDRLAAVAACGICTAGRSWTSCWPAGPPTRSRAVTAASGTWTGARIAAPHARANRQLLAEAATRVLSGTAGAPLHLAYDVAHNLATLETDQAGGGPVRLCVHRKGATRALPPGHPGLPADLRNAEQPVLIPGSMGTSSYVMAGVTPGGAFASACHGAGRRLSRHQAACSITGPALRRRLQRQGIAVRGASARGLAEETPEAYEDITQVVEAAEGAGLCRKVARLVPLGVIKG